MRIAVIADHLHPVATPFAGGLEAMTSYLSGWFAARGHQVTLFAAPGSHVPGVETVELELDWQASPVARRDSSMPDAHCLAVHHAYLQVLNRLRNEVDRFDLVHLHSLHPLPVALAGLTGLPSVLTLHSPPTPWLESALRVAGADRPALVCVSQATARLWEASVGPVEVIPNGVDLSRWELGDGASGFAAWCGRIVPEKAPHLAIAGARAAGVPLRIAGPIADPDYYDASIAPSLGDGVEYVGRLDHAALAELVGQSSVLLQTPDWDEPFCLAAAEAIACGTPVAAFARGGLAEVVGRHAGVLTVPGDADALAHATTRAQDLPRRRVRRHAEVHLSLDRTGQAYQRLFGSILAAPGPLRVAAA